MKRTLLAACIAALGAGGALAADAPKIDWSRIAPKDVLLFYPGQSSYEWLRSPAHKGADAQVAKGDACTSCHDDADDIKGDGEKIVAGNKLEPRPVKGKNGWVDLKVQAAYDERNLYLRVQWKTNAKQPGIEYPYYRFDGKDWKIHGFPRLDQVVQEGKQPGIYEDRFSFMLDDGKVPGFAQQGCWLTCHDGQRDMKGEGSGADARKFIDRADVRKYMPATRTNPSDWRTIRSKEELAKLKAEGGFLELIQWRAHRSNPVGASDDGYVLDFRSADDGKNPFSSNLDGKTKQPRYMFDAAKFGAKAVSTAQVAGKGNFLVVGDNAVAFDPNAGWKEGDMLPRYYLQQPAGSAGDNKGSGTWANGIWTVVVTRPLGLANPDDKSLKAGGSYSVGFAVHDDNITTRGHFVSFPLMLGIGTKGDIEAVKLP